MIVECNGFEEAVNAVRAADLKKAWLTGVTDQTLKVTKVHSLPTTFIMDAK